jgi:hypothetical protein
MTIAGTGSSVSLLNLDDANARKPVYDPSYEARVFPTGSIGVVH